MPKLYGALRECGVYTFGRYNIMMVAPPLIVEEAELDDAFVAIDAAIAALTNAAT
jgi:taurine--2-oxoglutarate transaminase